MWIGGVEELAQITAMPGLEKTSMLDKVLHVFDHSGNRPPEWANRRPHRQGWDDTQGHTKPDQTNPHHRSPHPRGQVVSELVPGTRRDVRT